MGGFPPLKGRVIMSRTNYYSRKEVLNKMERAGYNVTHHDLHWAVDNNLIRPHIVNPTMFLYDDQALQVMELLGELKLRGLNKSIVSKIIETDTLEIIQDLVMWSVENARA